MKRAKRKTTTGGDGRPEWARLPSLDRLEGFPAASRCQSTKRPSTAARPRRDACGRCWRFPAWSRPTSRVGASIAVHGGREDRCSAPHAPSRIRGVYPFLVPKRNCQMAITDSSTDPAEWLQFVFVERARCPACGADDLKKTRSVHQGDGSTRTTTNCRECGHHFFIIEE